MPCLALRHEMRSFFHSFLATQPSERLPIPFLMTHSATPYRIQRVYFIGLGAIGLKYAARLHDLDPSLVTVIASAARIAALRATPPTVNGKRYDFKFVEPGQAAPPADLIFVAVKAGQLPQAIDDLRGFVGPDTCVVSLMNGISSEDQIGAAIGPEHVLYANVYMDAVRSGNAVTYHDIGRIVFGEKDNSIRCARVDAIEALFQRAGIPCVVPADMMRAHWAKFMLNAGINQASAVLRAPYGTFQVNPHARALMIAAAEEVVTLSRHAGIGLGPEDIQNFVRIMDSLTPTAKTSMLQDIEAGRPTEVDLFAGTIIELGQRYGVATPVNQTLYQIIKAMEA